MNPNIKNRIATVTNGTKYPGDVSAVDPDPVAGAFTLSAIKPLNQLLRDSMLRRSAGLIVAFLSPTTLYGATLGFVIL
jgi:hypothetical protein